MAVELRRIRADEWRELRALRLRALLDAPDAFGSTYDREAESPEHEWLEWAAGSAEGGSSFTVVGSDDGGWIGMAMGAPDRDHPGQAGLFAMWVDPAVRGSGIGRGSSNAWLRGPAPWVSLRSGRGSRCRTTLPSGCTRELASRTTGTASRYVKDPM